jgi:hypothetical protein
MNWKYFGRKLSSWSNGVSIPSSIRDSYRTQLEYVSKTYRCANSLASEGVRALEGSKIASWPRIIKKKCKVSPVTGRGGPHGCETLRLPHFVDNRLTDGAYEVADGPTYVLRDHPSGWKGIIPVSDRHQLLMRESCFQLPRRVGWSGSSYVTWSSCFPRVYTLFAMSAEWATCPLLRAGHTMFLVIALRWRQHNTRIWSEPSRLVIQGVPGWKVTIFW